ncbi:MAG: right-handed parallel beta-helix repeat-containing protein, partial [Anaerolineae bacterium]
TVQSGTQATFEDTEIRGNATNTTIGGGGGIKIYDPGTKVVFLRVKVIGNEAADGAGVYVETQGTATITASEIRENRAGRYGAGLVLNDRVAVTISDSVVESNQASNNGGGLWAINQAQVKVEGSLIRSNQSGGVGGGVIVTDGSTVELKNNLIASNRSALEGDGLYLAGSTVTLTNNSVVHNDPGGGGDGLILVSGAAVHMTNNIVYGNGFGIRNGKPATSRRNDVYGNAKANYSGFTPDGSDLSVDPQFVNGYYLSQVSAGQGTTSPLVDAGSGSATDLGLHTRTTRTNGVPDQGTVDIGYHYPTSTGPVTVVYRFQAFVPLAPIRNR